MGKAKKYTALTSIQRVLIQAKLYWLHIALLFLLNLIATPIALLKPYPLKLLIDSAFGDAALPGAIRFFFPQGFDFTFGTVVLVAAGLVVLIALIENLNSVVEWVLGTYAGEKIQLVFRANLFDHIQRLSLAYHDTKGTSDSLYRIQWDTMSIRSLLIGQLSPLISSFLTLVAMIIVMLWINWSFALIALAIIPPLYLLTRFSTGRLRRDWNRVKDDESRAMSVVHEVLNSLRVVKAFGQEVHEGKRFIARSNQALKGQVKMAWMGAIFYFIVGVLIAIATALFFYLGAHYVHSGQMTLGELVLVLAYLAQVFGPLQNISKKLNDIQSSIASIDRVLAVMDKEQEVEDTPHAIHLSQANGGFRYESVGFQYEGGHQALIDVSFEVQPGDRVGIMGSTGAGKSTLISLLTRFYDPTTGNILIDGKDIRDYKLADYRAQFSIVLQDPVLFSSTIAENIAYGRPGATEGEIVEAAKAANALDFITRSKEGFNTLVGERGMQLSGGERQRISLARAFIKNAPVLIMDEPTSALDIRTEAQIMEAIERLMEGRTTFMITHRLDTLSSCNLILHLEHGKLVDVVRDHDIDYLAEKKSALLSQEK